MSIRNDFEKCWFYEANVQFKENFEDVQAAHQQNVPSDKAKVTVLETKFNFSRIKNKEDKKSDDSRSKKNLGTETASRKGIPKNAKV
jgi:hypothetical protein|tara:strand:- start:1058 stop:1318 length:261 start_codon:yes stop_codon:yes gene_type:complete